MAKHPTKHLTDPATYSICGSPSAAPGGSFYWNNDTNPARTVVAKPVTTWPLLQSSYTLPPGSTLINVPSTAQTGSYDYVVNYQNAATGPCGLAETTPKLIIS